MNDPMQRVTNQVSPWPVLRAAQDADCDGENPMSGHPCVLGDHHGYHRDDSGTEWLDEGDLTRPDWLTDHPDSPLD